MDIGSADDIFQLTIRMMRTQWDAKSKHMSVTYKFPDLDFRIIQRMNNGVTVYHWKGRGWGFDLVRNRGTGYELEKIRGSRKDMISVLTLVRLLV